MPQPKRALLFHPNKHFVLVENCWWSWDDQQDEKFLSFYFSHSIEEWIFIGMLEVTLMKNLWIYYIALASLVSTHLLSLSRLLQCILLFRSYAMKTIFLAVHYGSGRHTCQRKRKFVKEEKRKSLKFHAWLKPFKGRSEHSTILYNSIDSPNYCFIADIFRSSTSLQRLTTQHRHIHKNSIFLHFMWLLSSVNSTWIHQDRQDCLILISNYFLFSSSSSLVFLRFQLLCASKIPMTLKFDFCAVIMKSFKW